MKPYTQFEFEFAQELGLERVPGSGNQWFRKMDVDGKGLRFSLKYTVNSSITIPLSTIEEGIDACEGLGGTGEIPMWAFRREGYEDQDMVMIRKDDFIKLFEDDAKLFKPTAPAVEDRRKRAATPALLREPTDV